jgi:hypothetical protein
VKPRSLLVLLAVVIALGAFVWFYERKLPSTEEAKAQVKKVLAGVEADEVREVRIERGGASVKLVREGPPPAAKDVKAAREKDDEESPFASSQAEWRLSASSPGAPAIAARGDRSAVDGLLSSLLAIEKARTLERADRKQYGLEPPAARVTLVTPKVLEVGRELPGTDQRAVALAGEPAVHAVASSFWADLARPAGDWRSRELFSGSRDDVERISLQHGAGKVLLARRGDEPWMEAPLADRADQERFDQLVDALTGLQAAEFVDSPLLAPEALGLEPPQDVVEVVLEGKSRPFRLVLGNAQGEGEEASRYARADSQLVKVKAPALDEALARPAEQWRSRSWTSFAVYEVDEVKVKDGQAPLTLTRADADWKRGKVKIFYGTVSDLLGALADAKAEHVLEPAEAKGMTAGPPALTVELVGSGGKKQTLTLWPARATPGGAQGAPARTSGRDAVLLLPAGLPADLAGKVAAIRKAEPMKEEPTPTPSP